jgi:hypothetical protein
MIKEDIVIVDDVLTNRLNETIIDLLCMQDNWSIATDFEKGIINDKDNTTVGMLLRTLLENKPPENKNFEVLNSYALVITELICRRLNINFRNIKRFYWNYYRPDEKSEYHEDLQDSQNENLVSILYALNTTDGYVEFEKGGKYPDVSGQAKIFRSTQRHRGVGPVKDNVRFNLNIVLEL